jgi:hypothetical protein
VRLLGQHRDLGPKVISGDLTDLATTDGRVTLIGEEAEEDSGQGRLSCAARSDDRHSLARLNPQVDPMQGVRGVRRPARDEITHMDPEGRH